MQRNSPGAARERGPEVLRLVRVTPCFKCYVLCTWFHHALCVQKSSSRCNINEITISIWGMSLDIIDALMPLSAVSKTCLVCTLQYVCDERVLL